MIPTSHGRFPSHLASLVAHRLPTFGVVAPSDTILVRLFETIYFASLKTNESKPCRCTINFVHPCSEDSNSSTKSHTSGWTVVPFDEPIPLTVRSLLKLADAVDPNVSSVAISNDEDENLFIWGMVDQEIRYGDYVALTATVDPKRAGIFQATITGVGSVAVYKDFSLLGSLEQDSLISDYHDVLWEGPLHNRLRNNLDANLRDELASQHGEDALTHMSQVKDELLIRWQNSICRTLFNMQQYGHGGGLIIAPQSPGRELHDRGWPKNNRPQSDLIVKYNLLYDRLPKSLLRLAQHHILKRQTNKTIAAHCSSSDKTVPCDVHFESIQSQSELDRQRRELLGCVRFIASLSRVDGFVLMDRNLVVHGFGVETRSNSPLLEVDVAGDANATPGLFRKVPLSQFGTRHRAMLRYCDANEGALGFVISQDGDIRATMKHHGKLILWENINVQLAYRAENRGSLIDNFSPAIITGLFGHWMSTLSYSRSA